MDVILAGFTLGLFGSLHCIGMCGPIALALPYSTKNKFSMIVDRLSYNIGRVITYSFLGLIFGIFGHQFHLIGIQHQVSLITGIILISFFIFPKVYNKFELKLYQFSFFIKIKELLTRFMKRKPKLIIGILNGFIPCGFVYLAIAGALNFPHVEDSVLFMSFFGLGTIPLVMATTLLSIQIKAFRSFIFYLRRYSVLIIAVFFILHGMALGIPFLSPDIEINSANQVISDCCSKY